MKRVDDQFKMINVLGLIFPLIALKRTMMLNWWDLQSKETNGFVIGELINVD